ncbi:MAG: penicillin-binding protein, partial [Enterococcus viikkiensis]
YTPHYSLSIWTGYDKRMTPITDASSNIAQEVYRELMSYVSENVPNDDWVMPDDVIRSRNELYVKGSSAVPTQPSYSSQSSYYNNNTSYNQYTAPSSSAQVQPSVPESSTVAPTPTPSSSSEVTPTPTPTPTPSSSSAAPEPSEPSSSQTPPPPEE